MTIGRVLVAESMHTRHDPWRPYIDEGRGGDAHGYEQGDERIYKGKAVAARTQAAIDQSGLSRNEVAKRAGIEFSRLAKFCHAQLPLYESELAAVARAAGARLSDLAGVQLSDDAVNVGEKPDTASQLSAGGATVGPDRMGDGRRAYIEGHRDELSQRDIEWLQRVRIGVDDSEVDPDSERFWRSLLDWWHAEQIRVRDSGR